MGRGSADGRAGSAPPRRGSRKIYKLIGSDGATYESAEPGMFGAHRGNKIYGRLDCASALAWIARGHYVRHRVFFRDEETAIAAGYRPCGRCMPAEYAAWKAGQVGRAISCR